MKQRTHLVYNDKESKNVIDFKKKVSEKYGIYLINSNSGRRKEEVLKRV